MKRFLCLLIITAAMLLLASCGETASTEPPETVQVTEAPTVVPTEEGSIDLSAFISGFITDNELEQKEIFKTDNLTINADRIEYDPINGPTVVFTVDNTGEKDVLIQCDSVAVNSYMVGAKLNVGAPSGNKTEGEMVIPYTALALADINQIATVEFSLMILDDTSFETLAETDIVELKTTGADSYLHPCDDRGQTVFEDKDVRIILKGIDERRMFSEGPALIVYMYNGSDSAVTVQAEDITVNGYEFTSAMNTDILPKKNAVDIVTFFDMDMEEYGIEEIESVSLSFKILDEKTWKEIGQTDVIEVEL